MAEEGLREQNSIEIQQIMELIGNGKNFLLSGGAGSGKTYSLVQVIKNVFNNNPASRIACITFTNTAVNEIRDRVYHENLRVSTIHDFLWDNIKHFQKEMKKTIITLANDANVKEIIIDDNNDIPADYYENRGNAVEVQYKDYLNLKEGIISHDELLIIAEYMFSKYPKLCDIVIDKYPLIFLDEYQDTHKEVVKILLEHINKREKFCVIGFFGDAMQSIYDSGIGDIKDYIDEGKVIEIKIEQNRRNPKKIIELANRLRLDDLQQEPSNDISDQNMINGAVKDGTILFIYSNNAIIDEVKLFLHNKYNWNFDNTKETKELNLTHKLIADRAGYKTLFNIYSKDGILDYIHEIEKYIREYNINDDFSNKTFQEVINIINSLENKINCPPSCITFIKSNPQLYKYSLSQNWRKLSNLYISRNQLLNRELLDNNNQNEENSIGDDIIRHLFKIQTNIELYTNKKYNEFLQKTDYKNINSIREKRILKENIESLVNVGSKSIEEIINDADEKGICIKDERLERFIRDKEYIYYRVKDVKYGEFQCLYKYLEGKTPFATQHSIKGSEFNNVLVILDNGRWMNYNFEYVFIDNNEAEQARVVKRTRKIFYTCCTRSKENLAVYYCNPSIAVINKAKEWFGDENVIRID